MTITKEAIKLIKDFEQFRAEIYYCPAGLATIGYGHVIRAGENFTKIDHEAAENLLNQDIFLAKKAVLRNIKVALNQYQLGALVSFTFNVGAAALQRSTLRQKINRQLHHLVPEELQKWVYAQGVRLPGLVRRRRFESYLYLR
jgi:lysozyme